MRILSAPLLAAQKSASGVPYLKVVVSDRIGGIRRLAYTRLYTGSEPDGYHAATMPGDGSLLRARTTGGRLYYQRVTSPGPGSDFSAWTDLAACANAGVALCSDGARVLLFYADVGGTVLRVRESTDNGATLGAAVTVATAAGAVTWLAADVKTNGDAALLFSVGATVYAVRRTSGAWGASAAWSNSVASVSGLACYYQGDWNAAVTGTNAAGEAYVWTVVFGDGAAQGAGTWSALREVTRASAGSSLTFAAPFLAEVDVYRLTFVEKYTGVAAYTRPCHTYSPATAAYATNLWREPLPFDLASDYGQALAFNDAATWLSTPSGVWKAGLAIVSSDVTADVLEATAADLPFGGRLSLLLRNDGGRYNTLPAAMKLGAEVRLSPGYQTPSGAQASDGTSYWITGIEQQTGGGEAALALAAHDAWSLLEGWRARRQYTWAAGEKNIFNILQFLFARAGLEFSSTGSSGEAAALYPSFTVNPGETGLTAARRLLAMVRDVMFLRGEFGYLTEPAAAQATSYVYGTDHTLLSGRYGQLVEPQNRVQVFGKGVFGERFDWLSVQSVYDRLEQVQDANLTSQSQVETRADAVLRKAALASAGGEITAPVNCGQELYDVIEINDAGAGLASARRRVMGLALRYATGERPAYEQRLTLGGV